jgi:hypothetical protein
VLNVFVAQIGLQCPGVVASVRQRKTARMSKHVRMRFETELRLDSCPLDHPREAGGCERCSTL